MKFIKIYLVLITACIGHDIQAQTIQKALKSLRAKKYNEAASFLLSAENTGNQKTEILYGLSLLYSAPTNFQNPAKAAYCFRDANIAYSHTTLKEKKYLKKELKIDQDILKNTGNKIAKIVYSTFLVEGDLKALKEFLQIFPEYQLNESKAKKDWDLAEEAMKLKLEDGYNPDLEKEYHSFIKKTAPKEIAFAVLQVMTQQKIQKKDWDGAVKIYEKYKKEFKTQDARITKIISLLKEKTEDCKIKSISKTINCSGENYAPVLSPDEKKIYFCGRNRKDNLGNEDIFESKFENGEWSKPELIKGINKRRCNEAPLSVSPDNRMLISYKKGDLWYSIHNSDSIWSEPMPITSIDTKEFVEIDASITPDGNAILFASDREGNIGTFHHLGDPFNGGYMGNMDIYVSKKINETSWSKPINLGKTINSNLCERSPFLHPDMKTLYFSSASHGSLGGLDVYKSTRLSDSSWTMWSEPVNMGKSINTIKDDFDYKFSVDGERAYLTADRNDSVFIAVMDLPKKKIITSISLLVNVTDSLTNEPVIADISVKNNTDKVNLVSVKTNREGQATFVIPADKQISLTAESSGYKPASDKFDTYNLRDTVQIARNIRINPIVNDALVVDLDNIEEEPVTIVLNTILFDFNLYSLKSESFPELNRLVNFMKQNPDVFIVISGHTDNVGENAYNKKLSENRAISVKNYLVKNGCNDKHIKTVGYGNEQPVDTNDTEEGRIKNRRVEISISKDKFSIQ